MEVKQTRSRSRLKCANICREESCKAAAVCIKDPHLERSDRTCEMPLRWGVVLIVSTVLGSGSSAPVQIVTASGAAALREDHFDPQYPYAAAVGRDGQYLCIAVIIKPSFVLTTAQCFEDHNFEELQVHAGTFRKGSSASRTQVVSVASVQLHPTFNFAVVKLATPFESTSYVSSIAMAREEERKKYINQRGAALGFGRTEVGRRSWNLHKVEVKVAKNWYCRQYLGVLRTEEMCSFGVDRNPEAMEGHSGGFLVRQVTGKPDGDVLIGLAAFSTRRRDGNFNPSHPTGFIEIAAVYPWIVFTIETMSFPGKDLCNEILPANCGN